MFPIKQKTTCWSPGRVVKALALGANGKPREFDPRGGHIFTIYDNLIPYINYKMLYIILLFDYKPRNY